MQIKQSKLKPYNQLIQQLKSQALYLTQQKRIKLPICLQPSPSIISRIVNLISNNQKKYDLTTKKQIWPMEENIVMITQCNTLSIYTIHKNQQDQIELKQKQKFHMEEHIQRIIISHYDSFAQTDFIYFVLTYKQSNLMSLFCVKNKQNQQFELKHQYRTKQDILALQFISKTEFLLVTKKYCIYHYKIQRDTLKQIKQIGHFQQLNHVQKQSKIVFIKILSHPRQDQQTLTAIFYALWNEQTNRGQLSVKQMVRQLDGSIDLRKQSYQLFTSHFTLNDLKQVNIINQQDYFLLQLNHQIFVITKHFNKYVRLDAITQKSSGFKSLMISHHIPLLCCISAGSIQLWHVGVKNKKSSCTLMDVINIDQLNCPIKQNEFIRFWVMNYQNKIQTIFVVDRGGRQIAFFGVKRVDKVTKLVNKIVKAKDKNQIVKVQQLGKKLGVDRKSLYLKLWNQNPKNPVNIYQYLLQSYDLPSIHSELQKYMRHKFISTSQLIKIHSQIQKILLQKLKQQLQFKTLKWFLKTNFQKRKLKLYSFNSQITYKQFQAIYKSSIFDLIQRSIDKNLFQKEHQKKLSSPIQIIQKPLIQPEISIQHLLQQFKLVILQNYQEFLFKLLTHYKYKICQIINQYPYLLPKHPFKIQVFKNAVNLNSEHIVGTLLNSFINTKLASTQHTPGQTQKQENKDTSSYQKVWFSQITQLQWGHQKSSVDYIFNFLYPHYQTHQIVSLITQLTESQWNQKNKFNTHILINTTLNTFRQKVNKIQGIKLYLSVCQYINRIKMQAVELLQGQNVTKDVLRFICQEQPSLSHLKITNQDEIFQTSRQNLKKNIVTQGPRFLEIMKEKNHLIGQGYTTCLLYCKMHDLMITKEILKRETTIFQLMTVSHSSLIATFFLGNRQRNTQLFNDFMPIYSDKSIFYQSLNQYIKSFNCSRVQLQILVNELKNRNSQLKQQNSNLAQLLIYGFCLRTQIRQKQEGCRLIEMFQQIELKLDLALKLQKLIIIKNELSHIFEFFMCQKLNYQQVLNEPQMVIRMMMENYFNGKLNFQSLLQQNASELYIQGKPISLDIIENTFSIMLYLKQKLYIQIEQIDLCIIYGQILVDWQQFQPLKQIFYNQNNTNSSFDPIQYFQKLIVVLLNDIYTKENIYMNHQTINHIQNILGLIERQTVNPLIVRERTKLQLSKILEKWGYRIQAITLELICIKWNQQNKEELVLEIMDNCIQYFDLEGLENLYRLLEATRLGNPIKQVRNPQSIRLAYQLANRLRQFQAEDKDEQISKIIYFINKGQNKYTAQIQLMAETFLRIITKKYGQDPFVLQAQLKSQFQDLKKQDRVKEQIQPPKQVYKSNFLQINQPHQKQLYKSFQSRNVGFNPQNSARNKDKSYNIQRKPMSNSQNNISKRSLKSRMSNGPRDPISDRLKFEDQSIPQRIFNLWRRSQKNISYSPLCKDIIQIKQWHLKGKQAIQYFVLNWNNTIQINQMFRNNFSKQVWLRNTENKNLLKVNNSLCLKPQNDIGNVDRNLSKQNQLLWEIQADLNLIWSINVKACEQYIHYYITVLKYRAQQFYEQLCEKYSKILYYGYFFLLMGLKQPESIQKMKGISYQLFTNLKIIHQFEMRTFQQRTVLRRINFEQIWQKFHNGIRNYIISKIKEVEPDIKIPNNTEIKVLQRLINQLGKNKTHTISLCIKILITINQFLNKYVRQQKPKAMNQIKHLLQSKIIQLSAFNALPQIKKRTSLIKNGDQLRITLRQIQQVKKQILQRSQNIYGQQSQGIIKQMAQAFRQIKQSQNLKGPNVEQQNQQDIKQIVLKNILSKRQLNNNSSFRPNTSFHHPLQSQQFIFAKQMKQLKSQRPFQSSIILQNKFQNQPQFSPNQVKKSKFNNKNKNNLQQRNSFESQYFKSEKEQFQSIINIKSQVKNPSNYSSDFLEDNTNFQQAIDNFKIPYIELIYPQNIIKILASKDIKFQNKYHLSTPPAQQVINGIRQFSKLLNSYELYSSKNSKYYMQDTIKKMKNQNTQKIISYINQLYFEQDSILITLNKKQIQANNMRKSKGLGSQQEKYKKTKYSLILKLIQSLNINKKMYYDILVQSIEKFQKQIEQLTLQDDKQIKLNSSVKLQNNSSKLQNKSSPKLQNSPSRITENIGIKSYLQTIFPLKDIIQQQQQQTKQPKKHQHALQEAVETLFGRIYLSNLPTYQYFILQDFKKIVQFLTNFIEKIVKKHKQQYQNNRGKLQEKQKNMKVQQQVEVEQKGPKIQLLNQKIENIKNYFYCMLIWQILKYIQPSEDLKRKLQYLIQNLTKPFIVQIYEPTQLLLKNNSQLFYRFCDSHVERHCNSRFAFKADQQ